MTIEQVPSGHVASTAGPQFEGRAVRFGGREWIVAPLTLGPIKRLAPVLTRITTAESAGDPFGQLDDVVQVVHASLVRNYPELTLEQLEEALEIPALAGVVRDVLEVSGLAQASEDRAGNAEAGQG